MLNSIVLPTLKNLMFHVKYKLNYKTQKLFQLFIQLFQFQERDYIIVVLINTTIQTIF